MGGSFNNGVLNMNGGAMSGAAGQFGTFANNSGTMANTYSQGGVPSNVTSAFGNFNNQVGLGQNYANAGAGSSYNMMGMGTNMLNSANANQSSAYQTALQSGQAALNPQIQQQSNALLNSNFERGMAGTSGGALQTQALQNSFNTAELQNQNQAVGQGLNAFNSTINAGQGMFNSGAGQLGNFNNQGLSFGQAGMTGAMNYNMFSPQLAGAYQNNANSAVTGFGGINNAMLGNFQAGLGAITNQGTQMNRGAQTQVAAGQAYGNNNMWSSVGNGLSSPGAVNNLLGGASSLFSGLTGAMPSLSSYFNGGSGGYDPSSMSSSIMNQLDGMNFTQANVPTNPGDMSNILAGFGGGNPP
jgi:hypothetical protein